MFSLSDEIIVRIFSYLPARDLCRCSRVCTTWCRLANDFHLWKKLFVSKYGKFITDSSYYRKINATQWKEIYTLHSNWLSGHCHVQNLVHKRTSTPTQHVENTKVVCLKISKCGSNFLASVHENSKIVHLWKLTQRQKLHSVQVDGFIACIDFGSDCSRSMLAIGQRNNKFCLWDCRQGKLLVTQTNVLQNEWGPRACERQASNDTNISSLAVCRINLQHNKLATVTQDCSVTIWQLEFLPTSIICHILHTLKTFKPRCSVLDVQLKREPFIENMWSLSISHASESLRDWNLIGFQSVKFQGQSLLNTDLRHTKSAQSSSRSSSHNWKNSSNKNGPKYPQKKENYQTIKELKELGKLSSFIEEEMGSRASVSCLSISPCTTLVTSGQRDNTIVLWDTSTRCRKHLLYGHTGSVTCTHVDAHKVVSGSSDRTVKVWSLESGNCQLTLPGDHSTGVSCVTFNDQWVVSGDSSGEIKVWDFAVNSLSVLQPM